MIQAGNKNAVALTNRPGDSDVKEAPTLYSAPDPTEDPEAKRAMEELATLALQVQKVISTGRCSNLLIPLIVPFILTNANYFTSFCHR